MQVIYRKLNAAEFQQAMDIRIRVFVEEQNVPLEEEQDELDEMAEHFGVFMGEKLVGTGRLVIQDKLGKIGRVAILPKFRGLGFGRELIKTIITSGNERGIGEFVLGAQIQALGFYASLGFVPEGEKYLDGGIQHRLMRLVL